VFESHAILQVIKENKTQQILGEGSVLNVQHSLSEDVELLRSPVLFKNAIHSLGLQTFSYNDGKLLTENLYGFTPYSIITYQLSDSGMCGTNVYFEMQGDNKFNLRYTYQGKFFNIAGGLSTKLKSPHFEIQINAQDPAKFFALIQKGSIYFNFNNIRELTKSLQTGLSIAIVDEGAKTVQISYRHENRKLAYNLMQAMIGSYFEFEKSNKQQENLRTLNFINNQLDSLSMVLNISKDSLSKFQRSQNLPSVTFEENDITKNLSEINARITEINEEIYAVEYLKKTRTCGKTKF
jgi:hypothetical protein